MSNWITDNFPSLLVGLGLVLLVIEMVAFSMTGLVLTFAGLALCMLLVQLNANRFTRSRKTANEREQDADAVA